MTREIKFRMYDAGIKNMVPWENLQQHSIPFLFGYTSFPVMQFTGTHDVDGVEVYEGDVLQREDGKRFWVKWCVNCDGFIARTNEPHSNVYSLYHLAPKTKVIGNIYEHPDLLTETVSRDLSKLPNKNGGVTDARTSDSEASN